MKHYTRRHAFSLLELLVVIGIIVALAALLLPVLGGARESAKRAQCLSNLRQLTVAWIAYAHVNESHICSSQLGRSWSWSGPTGPNQLRIQIEADLIQPHPELENGVLWPYLKNAAVYRCPDDQSDPLANRCSFQINGYLAGTVLSGGAPALMKLDDITQSSKTFVWIEGANPTSLLYKCFHTPMYPDDASFRTYGWPGANHHDGSSLAVGAGISFADGHAIFWKYSDPGTGKLMETMIAGLFGPIKISAGFKIPPIYPPRVMTNSPDVFQLEAWSGGLVPPGVAQ